MNRKLILPAMLAACAMSATRFNVLEITASPNGMRMPKFYKTDAPQFPSHRRRKKLKGWQKKGRKR